MSTPYRLFALSLVLLLCFLALRPISAEAAVTCSDNPIVLTSNSVSDLQDAVDCFNNGNTSKTIDLNGFTFTLTNGSYSETGIAGNFGLPAIDAGAALVIQNGTIERDSSYDCAATNFRIVYTGNSTFVTLQNLTLRNGCVCEQLRRRTVC